MADNILVSFTDATRDVLKLMLDLEATSNRHCIAESASEQLRIAIEISGDICGRVNYRFPKETAIEIVKIMSGMEITEVDDFVTSAIGEVANIISGNAANNLYQRNFTCDIMPPEISYGEEAPRCQLVDGALIKTDIGVFNLDIVKSTVSF